MAWDNTSWGVQSLPKESIPKIQTNLDYLYNSIGGSPNITDTILALSKTYTDTKVAAMVDSAPETLDTLQELATALGDDPHFATTITNLIGTKAPLASPSFTGTVTLPQTIMTGAINENYVTMASASTMDIGSATGNTIRVTGITTIDKFGTAQAGTKRTLIFAGVLTVTYSDVAPGIIIPGNISVVTAPGDVMEVVSIGSGVWRCTSYYPASSMINYNRLGAGTIYHYKDLATFDGSSSVTGTIKITLPQSWTQTAFNIKLSGYSHSTTQAWEATLCGLNFTTGSWGYVSAELSPTCPITSVRFAHDGTNCCILLGTLSTVWSYAKITIADVRTMNSAASLYGYGWLIGLITSEVGITVSATATLKTLATTSYVPNISRALVSIDDRSTPSVPTDYSQAAKLKFKFNTSIGSPDGALYSTVLGLAAWDQTVGLSGGPAHELAFTGYGNLFFRSGSSYTAWNTWRQIATLSGGTYTGAITGALGGIANTLINSSAHGVIELGDLTGNATSGSITPFVDWHYAMGSLQDYNVRQINERDGAMIFYGNTTNALEIACSGRLNGVRHGFMLGNTGAYGYLDYDTSGGSVRLSALNNMLFGFNNAAAHNSNTFTERMRLTSAGNVGIGITSPGSLLHVNAVGSGTNGIIISQPTAGFSPFLTWRTGDTVNPQYSIRYIGGASGGLSFGLGDSSSFNSMVRFSSDGNIGIGNTAPTVPLDVSGQIKSTEAGSTPGLLITGKSSSVSGADMVIERSSSTSSAASAPNVLLRDLSTNYGSLIQSYGGQTQFYQLNALNPSSWIQAMYIDNIANILNTRMIRPIADNAYTCGDGTRRWSTVYAATSTIATSDERAKTDIIDSTLGLDFVNKLRPVSYKFKIGGNTVTQEEDGIEEVVISEAVENEDGSITPAVTEERPKYKEVVTPVAGVRTHYGMIAQEVKTTLGDTDFGGYIYDEETDTYGLRYEEFIAPLIKAVQELSATVASQTSTITTMQARLAALEQAKEVSNEITA